MLKDRIQLVINIKTEGNMSEFSRKTGLSTGFLFRIHDKAHRSTLEKILTTYPDIDREWLYEGRGMPPMRRVNKSNLEYLAESLTKEIKQLELWK